MVSNDVLDCTQREAAGQCSGACGEEDTAQSSNSLFLKCSNPPFLVFKQASFSSMHKRWPRATASSPCQHDCSWLLYLCVNDTPKSPVSPEHQAHKRMTPHVPQVPLITLCGLL